MQVLFPLSVWKLAKLFSLCEGKPFKNSATDYKNKINYVIKFEIEMVFWKEYEH